MNLQEQRSDDNSNSFDCYTQLFKNRHLVTLPAVIFKRKNNWIIRCLECILCNSFNNILKQNTANYHLLTIIKKETSEIHKVVLEANKVIFVLAFSNLKTRFYNQEL